jgi:hypothetical protein
MAMRTWAWLLLVSLAASADEATTLKWIADEYAKLGAAAKKDGLAEESVAAFTAALKADSEHAEAGRGLKEGRRPWVLRWDDATHAKFLAYETARKVIAKEAAARLVTLGDERKAAGSAKKAEAAWRWALEHEPGNAAAHERLGEALAEKEGLWYPKDDAARRNEGLLPMGAEWVPAKDAVARHSKWAEAWVEKSAHFEATCNASYEATRTVLARAEDAYLAVTRELAGLVDPPKTDGLMKLSYFATREEFDKHIQSAHGDLAEPKSILAFFHADDKTSHFFPIPANSNLNFDDHVYREVARHVLSNVWKSKGSPDAHVGYFAYVGLPLFFETIVTRDGKVTVGNPGHIRLAQFRKDLVMGKCVPLEKMVGYTGREVIADRHSQCATMAAFFMMKDRGRYREQFIAYSKLVYEGVAEYASFKTIFRKEPKELQAEWEAWVDSLK